MARTPQKARNPKARRVTRDLAPSGKRATAAKGGLATSGGVQVVMGDGSVRSGDGSVALGDGSVRFLKPTL